MATKNIIAKSASNDDVIPAEAVKKTYVKATDFDADKDWAYLLDKEPSSNHELFASIMRKALGEEALREASLEQIIYWFLAMHRWMQKSDANQSRPDFRGRELGSVVKGSETLLERVSQRVVVEGENAPLVEVRNRIDIEVPKNKVKPVSEATKAKEAKVAKADLIALAEDLGSELTEPQLKKLTVKKLEALIAELQG